jgi:hypothetical protein
MNIYAFYKYNHLRQIMIMFYPYVSKYFHVNEVTVKLILIENNTILTFSFFDHFYQFIHFIFYIGIYLNADTLLVVRFTTL